MLQITGRLNSSRLVLKTMGSAAERARGQRYPVRPSPMAPRRPTGPHSITDRAGARWQAGAGQTMATVAAQGAPRVLGRRRPRQPTSPANARQNLRWFPNHRCCGDAAASEAGPRIPERGAERRGARTPKEVSFGARCPRAGQAGGRGQGWSGRSRDGGGLARPSLLAPCPRHSRSSPGTYGGRGPRARRGSAGGVGGGGGGGWGEAPVAELRKRSRVAVGRGPGSQREGLRGEGRASRQTPPRGPDEGGAGAAASGGAGWAARWKLLGCRQRHWRQLRWPRGPGKPIGRVSTKGWGVGVRTGSQATWPGNGYGQGGRACALLNVPQGRARAAVPAV